MNAIHKQIRLSVQRGMLGIIHSESVCIRRRGPTCVGGMMDDAGYAEESKAHGSTTLMSALGHDGHRQKEQRLLMGVASSGLWDDEPVGVYSGGGGPAQPVGASARQCADGGGGRPLCGNAGCGLCDFPPS